MKTKLRFILTVCVVDFCVLQVALAQRISELKCQEYIDLAFEKTFGGDLSRNPIIEEFKTTNCDTSVDLIVGGQKALVGEFPHQAVLGYGNKTAPHLIEFLCGGSLISEWYVLTAAHCTMTQIYDLKPKIVRLGEHDLGNATDGQQDYEVARLIRHPKYRSSYSYHDIALVQLTRKVQFDDSIRPACLWTILTFNMTTAIASGFGRTSNENTLMSSKLIKVKLNMLDGANCMRKFRFDSILERGLTADQLCVGSEKSGNATYDTCNGDSGGPLQVALNIETCTYHVVGLTSFRSPRCGVGHSEAVYTQVASYLDWIEPIVWEDKF